MQALADALDWEETEGSGDSRVKGVIVPYGQLLAMYEGKPSAEVALPRSLKDGGVQEQEIGRRPPAAEGAAEGATCAGAAACTGAQRPPATSTSNRA